MNRLIYARSLLALCMTFTCSPGGAQQLHGAGATFPALLYEKWAHDYQKAGGDAIRYDSLGSGAGIREIKARTVDFGASDMPLDAAELEAHGLIQFPAVIGGVVPVVHIEGIQPGQLRLTGIVLADIYLGRITKWNDAEIAALNPLLKLPAALITPVFRADGSGTSFLFSDYLSRLSPAFKAQVGSGAAVKWPTGVGGKGNDGVAASVRRIDGAIGYVEYAYARKNQMQHVSLMNKAGAFVQPSVESFSAAAAGAKWQAMPGFSVILTNQDGASSWPISGASFILMHRTRIDPARAKRVLAFFDWAYRNGAHLALALDYVPLPEDAAAQVRAYWNTRLRDNGRPIWDK